MWNKNQLTLIYNHVQLIKRFSFRETAPENTKDNLANAMTKEERAVAESAAQLRQIAGPCTL